MESNSHDAQSGFTIIELLIVMILASFAMTAIFSTFRIQQKSYETQRQVAAMQQHLRAGMFMMVHELRMAGADPTDTGISNGAGAGFTIMGASQVRFTMDINDNAGSWRYDGDLLDTDEDISYMLRNDPGDDGISGNADDIPILARQVPGGNWDPVAEHIDSLQFVYLDAAGVATAVAADVRSVRITMQASTINTTPLQTVTLTSVVNCRNMGL